MRNTKVQLRGALLMALFLATALFSSAQDRFVVNGRVTDSNGQPLEGVTVQENGTKNIVVSKNDGRFSMATASGKATLTLSSVGYETQVVAVNNKANLGATLKPTASSMNEVVVVGYGTQKKSDVTGSLSRITADVIQERPAQNILQAMQGKAAGVQVSSNFKPGELPVVRVRGNRSLNASNDPLYVIDGIPMVSALGVTSFSMSDLNPDDIASIEILKDASATAIYGSRGANGVVLITTKKAKTGRVSISYTGTASIDQYHSLTHWMNGGEYADRWRLSAINGRNYHPGIPNNNNFAVPAVSWYPNPKDDSTLFGFSDPTAIASVMMGYDRNPDGSVKMRAATAAEKALGWPDMVPAYNSANIRSHNWIRDAVRTGITQNHQLSVSAGNNISRLSISLGYFDNTGVQRDQDYKRYNINLGGEITPNKWFTLGTSAIASLSTQNYGMVGPNTSNTGSKDLYSRAADQFPYALPKDASGNPVKNPGGNLSLWNPLIDIDQVINERRIASIMSNTYAEIKFTPWLKYRANFGAQYRRYRNGSWTGPNATSHLTNKPNTAGEAIDDNFSWVAENLLYVDKTFGKHKLGLTFLQSAQKSRRESIGLSVSGTTVPVSLWYNLAANTAASPGYGSSYTENTLTSYMGRVNYAFNDRYLFTASGRFDGASVLAESHKWDFFPSFAFAWKMQDEPFLKNVSWISELKPRIGYGVTGNSSVNPYQTSGPLSLNPYVFGSAAAIGFLPQVAANLNLGWEKTAQANLGLDFSLLNSRIGGSIELYDQQTSDLLMLRTLPAVTGYVQKWENIGKTRNRGIEITLSTVNIHKGDFTWSTDINWSANHEEIVELQNGKQDMIANGLFIGQPTQVFYNYKNAGIWGSSDKDLAEMAKFNANGHKFYPGTVRVVDQNGDHKINASDYMVLGSARPKWTGGITNTFRYKGWTLSSFIYLRWGQMYFGGYPNSYGGIYPNGRVENNIWSWTGQTGRWPMANNGNVENITSAMQYNDGSFGVIRNISLSYAVPKDWLRRLTATDLTLNFQVLNPYMFGPGVVKWGINPDDDTNWSIASSNTNPLGGTNNNTILPQSFVFGIRAGF